MDVLKEITKAYSTIIVKADEDKREFTGIATTPSTDRVGDIVEPEGAEFKLPIPLLWQHNRDAPIGEVTHAKVTKKGIEVRGRIPKIDKPSQLAARLEEAWASIKAGLVRGLSIGFSPLEYSFMDSGGIHFTKWSWNELSPVTVPANGDASITAVKQLANKAGVSVKLKGNTMDISEQIKGFEAARDEKIGQLEALIKASGDEGRAFDEAEKEQYDTLEAEIEATNDHIKRLQKMLDFQQSKAVPVSPEPNRQSASSARDPVPAVPKVKEKLAPGIEFARYVMCVGAAKGNLVQAQAIAESRFPHSERINLAIKAAVAAGTTEDSTWASPLVEYNQFAGDFVEYLRPQTILGKFGTNGIPSLMPVPFNTNIRGQTSGGSGYWVGQGKAKPLTSFDFNNTSLTWAKVANIAVLTDELLRFSNPNAEMLVRNALAEALRERMDIDFIDPEKVAESNVSPASISYGVTSYQSSGTDADAVRADVQTLVGYMVTNNISAVGLVWIMSANVALTLSLMRNSLGQREFPDITIDGGMFEGLPVITSENVPSDSNGNQVFLVSAPNIWLADDGAVTIDASREASLEMADSTSGDSDTPSAVSLVSMWQTNSVAIKAERYINWQKRRSTAVAWMDQIRWAV